MIYGRNSEFATPCGVSNQAPTVSAKACTAPTFEEMNAIPPIVLAIIMFLLASLSSPFSYAFSRFSAIIEIPFSARASVIGWCNWTVYASIQCVKASTPHAAVKDFGSPIVISGSQIAKTGIIWTGSPTVILYCLSVSVITAHHVTSAPVPEVDGMQISGSIFVSNSVSPHSTVDFPFVTTAPTAFAWSTADPPPNAISASTWFFFANSAISSQSSALGFGFTFVSKKFSIFASSKLFFSFL